MSQSEPTELQPTPPLRDRKAEHLALATEARMQMGPSPFEPYVLEHCALPEIDYDAIDLGIAFLGRRLRAPLLISCMTGGTGEAARINRHLAMAAEETGVAVGVGSQRKALEDRASAHSFRIRRLAPSVPVLANLGAVQLNYGFGIDECRAAVEMVEADALVLHLNALQEAIQPEGQRNFEGLLQKIGAVVEALPVPVIVKEVGCGISGAVAQQLAAVGVRIVDCAGTGGTSWARIESVRSRDAALGEAFATWGLPTPVALRRLRAIEGLTIIGSGGLRNGVDVAKAIAAGAHLAGMAYPFLLAARESNDAVVRAVTRIVRQLRIAMFCVGAGTIADLRQVPLQHRDRLQ